MVSQVSKTLKTFHGGTLDSIHAALIVTAVRLVTIGETTVAPMPKTTQELPPTSTRDLIFTLVASVMDTLPMVWKRVFLLQPMFLPQEPFRGGLGVVGDESPYLDKFGDDGILLEAIVMQTSSSDRHFVKGTKAGLFVELMMKGHPSRRSLTSEIQ